MPCTRSALPRSFARRLCLLPALASLGSLAPLVALATACANPAPSESVGHSAQAIVTDKILGTSLPPRTLALTFDDGPGGYATYGGQDGKGTGISQYLHSLGIRAVFFDVGAKIAPTQLPNTLGFDLTPHVATILAQVAADGHLVANHTATHRDLVTEVLPLGPAQIVEELTETHADIAPYVTSGAFLFRAPYDSYDPAVAAALQASPMNLYVGPLSADIGGGNTNYPAQAADWACWQGQTTRADGTPAGAAGTGYLTTKECGDAYLTEIGKVGRGIVLMHEPFAWAQGNTLAMLEYIVPILIADGYTFVRADEVPDIRALLGACDPRCASCKGTAWNDCTSCGGGSFLSGGTCAACATCQDGTFESAACTATRDTQCATCDATCANCSGAGPTACTACGAGTYLSGGSCLPCTVCAAGSYEVAACAPASDAVCGACAAGRFTSAPGQPNCTLCAAGTMAALPGASGCALCGLGTFAGATGSVGCAVCAAGTSASPEGQTACTTCGSGAVAGAGAATCSTCAAGSAAAPGDPACTQCLVGTSAPAGAGSCAACAPGTFAGASAPSCALCPPGSVAPGGGSTSCLLCAAGTFAGGAGSASCVTCAAGTFAAGGAAACTSCGSCDDGDSCTADRCDAIVGCVHAVVPSCGVDAGARVADAGPAVADAAAPRDAGGPDAAVQDSDAPGDAAPEAEPVESGAVGVGVGVAGGPLDAGLAFDGGGPDAAVADVPEAASPSGGCGVVLAGPDEELLPVLVWLGLVVLRRRSRRPPVQSVRSRSQSLRPHGRTAGESRGWGARGERLRSPRPRPGTTE